MLHAAELEIEREGKPAIVASAPWPPEFGGLGFADG